MINNVVLSKSQAYRTSYPLACLMIQVAYEKVIVLHFYDEKAVVQNGGLLAKQIAYAFNKRKFELAVFNYVHKIQCL